MEKIYTEWNKMIDSGVMPLFEFTYINSEGEEDYYVFNIYMHPDGLTFDIPDTDVQTWFSGNIVKLSAFVFLLPFNEYSDDLNRYFEQIYLEIIEGYLIPNGIHVVE